MTQPSPKLAPFNPSKAPPDELYLRKAWIGWRAVLKAGETKPDKVPVCIRTGLGDGYLLPENHVSYDEAVQAVQRLHLSGVGFVLTKGCGLVGGDMDKCRDALTGVIEPWAQAVMDMNETYLEVSPSGTGIRFWALEDAIILRTIKSGPAGVEIYPWGRFLTFTGDQIAGSPSTILSATRTLQTLMDRVHAFKAASPAGAAGQAPAPDLDELFKRKASRHTPMGKIKEAALANLDKWVPELFPTAEHQPGTGAWRVKSADLGRGLQEDLSLAPGGIVDWGVHDMGDAREGKRTAIDVVMEWSDAVPKMDAADAAKWLGDRLGIPFEPGSGSSQGPDPVKPLDITCPTIFTGNVAPVRRWIVPDWIPYGSVTGLYGDGGMGKSLLAQQLQTSTALGRAWLGIVADQVKSLALYCEDDNDELWRRQENINAGMFCDHKDLGDMRWTARPGEDNLLMVFGRAGVGELTRVHGLLLEEALDLRVKLVIVDTAADTYGGNENDRGQTRQYVQRALGSIAKATSGAVVCCAHPSLSGMASGTGSGGSTAWNNAFRSRHYLELPKDEPDDSPLRTLTRKKANYAARGAALDLTWKAGMLILDGSTAKAAPARDVFMDLLAETLRQGRTVSPSLTARNGAGTVFGNMPRADRRGYGKADFWRAMETLLRENAIVSVGYKNKGYESFRLEFPGGISGTGTSPGHNSPF